MGNKYSSGSLKSSNMVIVWNLLIGGLLFIIFTEVVKFFVVDTLLLQTMSVDIQFLPNKDPQEIQAEV